MSRLHAQCRLCHHQGSRTEFYRDRPGDIPAFGDVCPACGSENVDIVDPAAAAIAARTGYGGGGVDRAAA